MKIEIRENSVMSTAHGDRLEQMMLCLLDSQALIMHTLAHQDSPDRVRLKSANDRIVALIERLYSVHTGTLQ